MQEKAIEIIEFYGDLADWLDRQIESGGTADGKYCVIEIAPLRRLIDNLRRANVDVEDIGA